MRYSILKYLFIFCLSIALYACNMESNDILVPAKQLIERQIGIRANEITCQVIEPVNGKELRPNWDRGRRRQWHPTPVLLPGKSHGRKSLVGCSPWGR